MESALDTIRSDIKNWWWYLVAGLLSITAGIAIYARPLSGYLGLSILLSLVIIGSGLCQIFFSTANRTILPGWGWILASGILDLTIGAYLLMYPVITMATLPYFVGFWLVVRAFHLIGVSFDLRNFNMPGWGWLLVGGLLVLALGFLTIYYPAVGAISIIAVSGSAFILGGFSNIYLAFQLKNLKNKAADLADTLGQIKEELRHA